MSAECPKHGPFAPATFCCACTREKYAVPTEAMLSAFLREITMRTSAAEWEQFCRDFSAAWAAAINAAGHPETPDAS